MPKLKLIIITAMIILFSVFNGLQVARSGIKGFFAGFIVTFLFFTAVFLFQTLFYIVSVRKLTATGELDISDYQSPFDIWLISIPMCVLMMVTYLFLGWYVVQVYICTAFGLIGMLLGNALGRGSRKWTLRKSMPFFTGVIASTVFSMLMGWLV
ncbi:MAG: hypothetical protein JXB33_08195 [Clostridia bacterium]|nr:hypothetical protein [Clostridia bacterium]